MPAFARLRPLAALLLLGLAACSLPQPFQSETTPPLTAPGVRAGLVIEPFEGAADPEAFGEALAAALADEDVAATTDNLPAPAYRMFGRAVPNAGSVEIQWGIENAQGEEVGGKERRLPLDQGAQWRAGDPAFYRELAKTLASEAAAALVETRVGAKDTFAVVVPTVDGAPGDGPRNLQRSMIYVLEKRGVKVTPNGDPPPEGTPALTLRGVMKVTPVSGHSHVDMTWSLQRDDGSEIGKVEQANDVPTAMLSGQWADIAFAIADSASDSITTLIDHAAATPAVPPSNPPPPASQP